jgi:hypothetical protein
MVRSLLFMLLSLLFLTSVLAQSSSSTGSSGSAPIITHITGCADVGISTIDCPRVLRITLHGSGFIMPDAKYTGVMLQQDDEKKLGLWY